MTGNAHKPPRSKRNPVLQTRREGRILADLRHPLSRPILFIPPSGRHGRIVKAVVRIALENHQELKRPRRGRILKRHGP
ncbi:MAG: hypothetical protein JNL45_08980 [Hyphomicrobium sp.]|jgi:hypothetical protein|nr:hypothetical protein [Hyphomicrobium sp.]